MPLFMPRASILPPNLPPHAILFCVAPSNFETSRFTHSIPIVIIATNPFVRLGAHRFYTGHSSSPNARLTKNVTRPRTSSSSSATPSMASPSSVISDLSISFANWVRPAHRIRRTSPTLFLSAGSMTAKPTSVSSTLLSAPMLQITSGDSCRST